MSSLKFSAPELNAFCAVILYGSISVSPAFADDSDHFELSPEQLFNATVMSVSKTSEKLMDAPAAAYVLSNEDIRRSGATSIPEALRLVPGVQVARTHAGGWAVSIRGFNSGLANKLLVLIDGRELYDRLFSGVYWDVQDTVLEDIERIEVIRGPGATLWGANAVNGVINIITKKASDTQGGLVSTIAGNQDRAITTGRYGGRLGDNGHYRAYAKYLYRDEQKLLSGIGAQDPQQAYRAGFRTDWDSNEGRDSFTVQGDAVHNNSNQYRFTPFLALHTERVNVAAWNILGRWTRKLGNDSRLSVQSYIDYTFRDQMVLADQRTSYDLEGQYELPQMGRHKMITGARYRLSHDELTVSSFATTTNPVRNDQLFSGFLQDKITLSPERWFLTVGSKFDYNDYSGFEIQPNARLQWHINDGQMAWASVARAVRTPSQLEHDLNINLLLGVFGLQANPTFDSEDVIAYELGYRKQITPELQLDVATFYNDYQYLGANLVRTAPFPITLSIVNGTDAETFGGETALNWQASKALNLSASYSLLQMQLHGPAGALDAETAEDQSPQHQFNTRAQWNINDDLELDTILYYVGSLPNYQVDHYWRLDVRLGWALSDGVRLDVVGQNLFNGAHHEFIDVNDNFTPATKIEPSIYGKITWQF